MRASMTSRVWLVTKYSRPKKWLKTRKHTRSNNIHTYIYECIRVWQSIEMKHGGNSSKVHVTGICANFMFISKLKPTFMYNEPNFFVFTKKSCVRVKLRHRRQNAFQNCLDSFPVSFQVNIMFWFYLFFDVRLCVFFLSFFFLNQNNDLKTYLKQNKKKKKE